MKCGQDQRSGSNDSTEVVEVWIYRDLSVPMPGTWAQRRFEFERHSGFARALVVRLQKLSPIGHHLHYCGKTVLLLDGCQKHGTGTAGCPVSDKHFRMRTFEMTPAPSPVPLNDDGIIT
jgi:hypothetical protein